MKHAWTLTKSACAWRCVTAPLSSSASFFPLALLFLYLGCLRDAAARHAVPYLLASVLSLTVMGSFWGLSVQLVTFREQGILRRFRIAPVSAGAMLASSILSNYLMTLPTVIIEFAIARETVPSAKLGKHNRHHLAGHARHDYVRRAGTDCRQRHQYHAGDADHQSDALVGIPGPFRRHSCRCPCCPDGCKRLAAFQPATYLVTGLERVMVGQVSVLQIAPGTAAPWRYPPPSRSSSASSCSAGNRKPRCRAVRNSGPLPP